MVIAAAVVAMDSYGLWRLALRHVLAGELSDLLGSFCFLRWLRGFCFVFKSAFMTKCPTNSVLTYSC